MRTCLEMVKDMSGYFGFIHEKIEIKILILFIMRRLPEPVGIDVLTELAICDDGISYFDLTECIAQLVETGHIQLEDGMYSLTDKGRRNGEITENSLPLSVRISANKAASKKRAQMLRNGMISAFHSAEADGGYKVSLKMSDGIGEVISVELLASSEKYAFAMESGFRKNAEQVYNKIVEMLLE